MVPFDMETLDLALRVDDSLEQTTNDLTTLRLSEDEIHRLEQSVRASLVLVERLKNESRRINRMPRAILCWIFQLVRGDPPYDPFDPWYHSGNPHFGNRWIFITHVCKHWRTVAHDTPILWRRINVLDNPTLVQFFLDKSFSSPLSVSFGGWPKNIVYNVTLTDSRSTPRALRLIRQNMDLVEDLHFFSTYPAEVVLQADNFSRFVVPDLSISTRRPSEPRSSSSNGSDLFFEFFSTPAPSLRKLSLHGSPVSSFLRSSVRRTTLTHLALYEQLGWHEHQPGFTDLDRFLDLLQEISSTLQNLIFVRAGPLSDLFVDATPRKDTSKRQPVVLMSLKSLELGDWPTGGQMAHFLAHLNIPGTAKRCIWGPKLKYISSILFPIDVNTARTKHRGWDSDVKRVVLTCAPGGDMVGIANDTVYIQGHLDFQSIYPLFRDLPLVFNQVEELCLTPTPHQVLPSSEEYKLLFQVLPNIRRLSMNDMDIGVVLQALGVFTRRSDEAIRDICLPELLHLDIRYSTQNSSADGLVRDALGTAYQISALSSIIGLTKVAQIRARDGCPLESVSMEWGSRSVSTEDRAEFVDIISRLQQFVERVTLEWHDGGQDVEGGIDLVSKILEGMWPTIASKGIF